MLDPILSGIRGELSLEISNQSKALSGRSSPEFLDHPAPAHESDVSKNHKSYTYVI